MGSILAQALSLVRVNSPHFTDRVTVTPRPHPALCPTVKTSSSVGLLSHKCADFTNTTSSLSSVLRHWAGFPSLCEHTPWDLGISASLSSEPAAGGGQVTNGGQVLSVLGTLRAWGRQVPHGQADR